jgi:phosphatidylglycerophosphate synthase
MAFYKLYIKHGYKLILPFAKRMEKVHPNTLTLFSLASAVLAALCFYFGKAFLLFGVFFVIANSVLDLLDGEVARLFNKESKKGDFLDKMVDTYSDTVILLGITFSAYCKPVFGLLALVAVLLVRFTACQAEIDIGVRIKGGVLGRGERNILLIIVPTVQYLLFTENSQILGFSMIEWLMIAFIVFGYAAAIERFCKAWKIL